MLTPEIIQTIEAVAQEYGVLRAKTAIQRLYNRDMIEEADAKDLIAQIQLKTRLHIELR